MSPGEPRREERPFHLTIAKMFDGETEAFQLTGHGLIMSELRDVTAQYEKFRKLHSSYRL